MLILNRPKILMIAGEQQNVGKTTLACRIISHFAWHHPLIGLKVSPHMHQNVGDAQIVLNGSGWQILEETNPNSNKDTGQMLKAGAEKSYFIQAWQNKLLNAYLEFEKILPENKLIVCESAGLRDHIKPGIYLVIRHLYCKVCSIDQQDIFNEADRIVTFTVNGFDISMDEITIHSNSWKLK